MTLLRRLAYALPLYLSGLAAPLAAQDESRLAVPWGVGERSEYEVKFGKIRAGSASMTVSNLQDIRGREAWHVVFRLSGGVRFLYHVEDTFESWIDTRTGNSLRFRKDQNEGRRDIEHVYNIFPERGVFIEDGDTAEVTVKDPLDDAAFFYFVRTVPLVVGETYEFHRYFRPDRNPVTIKVLRKDTVDVAGARRPAIVIQPVLKTPGIFSENGKAEVWLSDDPRRIVLQIKSSLPFGSINLYLKSYTAAPSTGATPP